MKSYRSFLLLAAACTAPLSSQAATIAYEATDHPFYYSFNIQGITSSPGGPFSNAASSSYIHATLNTTTSTFTVDQVDVEFTNVGKSFTSNVTIGFGQSVPLDFEFTARPFGFHVSGGETETLIPGEGGNYTIGNFASAASVSFDPIIIDYKITDPATGETVTGTSATQTFSQEPMWATLNPSGTLNTLGYPDQLLMDKLVINAGGVTPGTDTITRQIAGGSVTFNLSYGFFNIDSYSNYFEGDNRITLNRVVPEPASAGMLVLGALGVAFKRRRRGA